MNARVWCVWYVCVCVCTWDPRASLSLFVVWLLIRGHLVSWSPSEGLVEAAISTQHSPKATWKAFYPALCSLFLINIPHSPASQAKLPHLYLFRHKPASTQHCFIVCVSFFNSQPFYFSCRFSFCSEKSLWSTVRQSHTHVYQQNRFHRHHKNWHEK